MGGRAQRKEKEWAAVVIVKTPSFVFPYL